jgi:hypothetical protein
MHWRSRLWSQQGAGRLVRCLHHRQHQPQQGLPPRVARPRPAQHRAPRTQARPTSRAHDGFVERRERPDEGGSAEEAHEGEGDRVTRHEEPHRRPRACRPQGPPGRRLVQRQGPSCRKALVQRPYQAILWGCPPSIPSTLHPTTRGARALRPRWLRALLRRAPRGSRVRCGVGGGVRSRCGHMRLMGQLPGKYAVRQRRGGSVGGGGRSGACRVGDSVPPKALVVSLLRGP